jgi:hypothetical protein
MHINLTFLKKKIMYLPNIANNIFFAFRSLEIVNSDHNDLVENL